ncbi:hypothetical protein [Streptomyces sp. NPDC016845]|uniref:hypothetical protein n=1 Tax=Streptomyces sp. NPDC016845 TaxID=3364972 RepID=UPI003793397A
MALDGKGTAYVASGYDGKLYAVNLQSGRKKVVAQGLEQISGVALTGKGTAYIAAADGQAVLQ